MRKISVNHLQPRGLVEFATHDISSLTWLYAKRAGTTSSNEMPRDALIFLNTSRRDANIPNLRVVNDEAQLRRDVLSDCFLIKLALSKP